MRKGRWLLAAAALWSLLGYAGNGNWINNAEHVLSAVSVALKGSQVLLAKERCNP